jgi:futalosine hydrolase
MGARTLLLTATAFEVAPTLISHGVAHKMVSGVGVAGTLLETPEFDCLVTGVGQLQCAVHLVSLLRSREYGLVIQAGLAGSFNSDYYKCSVVVVGEEVLGDLGAEAGTQFLDICDMGLLNPNQPPFQEGVLRNPNGDLLVKTGLPLARSVTVNRTLGTPLSIGWIAGRYAPDIVNMEGAALFYGCLLMGVPFLELRAISDMVGPRDKSAWDIPGSVKALNLKLMELLVSLSSDVVPTP